MNDIILSSLLNLFALFGTIRNLDKEKSRSLIKAYLNRYYGVRNPQSYINLYNDLRDFYEEFPDLDKEGIVDGLCTNLQKKASQSQHMFMLLSLLEFCKIGSENFNPDEEPLFSKLSEKFNVGDQRFNDFKNYVLGREEGDVKVRALWNGKLKTLLLRETSTLIFTCENCEDVLMNDVPVFNGIYQVWQQSGVLRNSRSGDSPIYYSTVIAAYEGLSEYARVELCGGNVDFRFNPGSDMGIHDFSFRLEGGQLVAIMGGSGVGKTTLLSLLNGNLKPQSGSITINGYPIDDPKVKSLIGFVPQDDLLIGELTVYQNLWFTAKLCFDKMSEDALDARVLAVLRDLGLEAAKDLKVGSALNKYISGGQRKRLNIALELIREPSVLFLDEPTSGLSSKDTEMVVNLLKEQSCKGRLVVVNIHQPSSDVYKLFDHLWLLDKGGYPIYDGNPIEAVSYFKAAADYADAQTSTCPVCGNVNPEIILNIIEETSLDSEGNRTSERRRTAKMWNKMYMDRLPSMGEPSVLDVPVTEQKRPGGFMQMLIFLKRNIKARFTDLQYVLVTLLEAPVLALICAVMTRYVPESGVYTLMDNKNLPSYIFMAIIVAIFLGMSGSAEEIIKDRALLKRERFLNLSYSSYIWSKIGYMAAICLGQTLLFLLVGNSVMGINCLFWHWWLLMFVSAFLSSLIGLLLSQSLSSVVAIYISIPLLLIPQILLCGLVVNFEDLNSRSETGYVPVIGDVIPSRWAYEAMAVATFTMNDYEALIFEEDRAKYSSQYYADAYIHELEVRLEKEGADDFIQRGISLLASDCGLEDYSGDWSYDSVKAYLDASKSAIRAEGNSMTLYQDRILTSISNEYGSQALLDLKKSNYNMRLESLMIGGDGKKACVTVGSSIVPRSAYVFLTPRSKIGRAPFYSGVKRLGDMIVPTFWYDICVLLLFSVLFGVCLLNDFPGRFVRKEKN